MFGAPSLRRLRHTMERELDGIAPGEDPVSVLGHRARRLAQLVLSDLRGAPMRMVLARRLRAELDALLPWRDEEQRRVLSRGHLPPVPEAPAVSVIVPVYGHLDLTVRCLLSLGACPEETPFEIIVVDDCSPDDTEAALSCCPGIRYVRNDENLGFLGSVNRGASLARGHYLHFLNNDTVVLPGWLDELVETHVREPRAGIVGSKLIYPNASLQEAGGVVWRDASATNWGNGRDPFNPTYSYLRDVDYVSGASLLIDRALFEELGGFDPRYAPAYYEDTDLAFRVREAGRRVLYQPASRIIHYEGATSGTDVTVGPKRNQVENRARFFDRWQGVLESHGPYGDTSAKELDRVSRASVLVLDFRTPKPDHDSGSVDMVNMLRVLRKLGLRVTFLPVIPLPRGLPGPTVQPHAGPYTESLQRMGVECQFLPYEPSVERFVRERGREFDVVMLHRARVADRFLPEVRRHCPDAKVVFNTVDLCFLREEREARHYDSAWRSWRASDTRRRELGAVAGVDATIVLSSVEAEVLAKEAPGARVHVAPLLRDVPGLGAPRDGRRDVLFIGHYKHRPNIDAVEFLVREIWPEVRRLLPDARLHVVGSDMPRSFEELAAEDIEIHGFVPNLEQMLESVRLTVAPLRYGAGLKGKVAESLGHGIPCVSTSMGIEGSGLRDGEEILVADEPTDFAEAIRRLYTDDALWNRLSGAGVEFVRQQYALDTHVPRFRELFAELGVQAAPAP